MSLSGQQWCSRFPNSSDPDTLAEPFRTNAKRFLAALKAAGATVKIAATRRSKERAWLMHYAWRIAREGLYLAVVPQLEGVDIQWIHPTLKDSYAAAEAMVKAYGIVHRPALTSRHIEGRAIDMNIVFQSCLKIARADGAIIKIGYEVSSAYVDGNKSPELHAVGASYGVHKLVSDPPHWSEDGR